MCDHDRLAGLIAGALTRDWTRKRDGGEWRYFFGVREVDRETGELVSAALDAIHGMELIQQARRGAPLPGYEQYAPTGNDCPDEEPMMTPDERGARHLGWIPDPDDEGAWAHPNHGQLLADGPSWLWISRDGRGLGVYATLAAAIGAAQRCREADDDE